MGDGDIILYLLTMLASIAVITFFEYQLTNSKIEDKSAYKNIFQLISLLGFLVFVYSLIRIALIILPTM